jgi:predicted HTH transcriptional regulator
MNEKELRKLLQAGESSKVEFRSKFNDKLPRDNLCICLIILDGDGKPGYIIIGVNDDESVQWNCVILIKYKQQLLIIVQTPLFIPLPVQVDVQLLRCDEGDVVVVKVEPSSTPTPTL